MSNVIHGASHKALKYMRKEPAALAVYWGYISRTNADNVAYPSLRGLAEDTGWSVNACRKARAYLVKHEALEPVKDYIRREWRKLDEQERSLKINLDQSEYYRPTGKIVVAEGEFSLLYFGKHEETGIEEYDVSRHDTSEASHVSPDDTSPCITPCDMQRGDTELSTNKDQLDSNKSNARDPQNTKPRKPATRSDNFRLLALESFGIADADALDKTAAIRVQQLESWVKNNSPGATVETLKAFYCWYDKSTDNAARPRDAMKFGTHFIAFRQQHLVVKKAPPEVINAGEKRIPHEWGINEFARQPAQAGDYD